MEKNTHRHHITINPFILVGDAPGAVVQLGEKGNILFLFLKNFLIYELYLLIMFRFMGNNSIFIDNIYHIKHIRNPYLERWKFFKQKGSSTLFLLLSESAQRVCEECIYKFLFPFFVPSFILFFFIVPSSSVQEWLDVRLLFCSSLQPIIIGLLISNSCGRLRNIYFFKDGGAGKGKNEKRGVHSCTNFVSFTALLWHYY